jgi:thiopeptide-type bacteriocin biosynthesis protein
MSELDRAACGTLEERVLRVLGGAPPRVVAEEAGLDPGLLRAGAEAYRAAGRQALTLLDETRWEYWRIEVPEAASARHLVATQLAPLLDRLTREGSVDHWWFLVKHDGAPHVRLRLLAGEPALTGRAAPAIEGALEAQRRSGRVSGWRTVPYEPETALFGGGEGMRLSHSLLHRDSRAACRWLGGERAHTEEASFIAIRGLLTGAELDVFEQGDVWSRVASHRPMPADRLGPALARNGDAVGRLYAARADDVRELLGDGAAYRVLEDWTVELGRSGRALAAAARRGGLRRGLRAILATHVVFHWNRLGLSGAVQAGLAHLVAGWIFDQDHGPLQGDGGGR